MAKKYVLRGTGDEGCQWVEVSYERTARSNIRVTSYQPDIPVTPLNEHCTEDIARLVGREFEDENSLSQRLRKG